MKKASRREFLAGSGAVALAGLAPGIAAARPRRSQVTEFPALEPGVRPNIVSVMCDDLNLATVDDLDSFDRIFGSQGIAFTNGCVTSPLCAPSRTSILTGQYAHNHGLWNNKSSEGTSYDVLKAKRLEDSTYATVVQQAGYATAHIGKYINHYNELRIPPGWSEWYSWLGLSQSGKVNDNGTLVDVGDMLTTDLCSDRAVEWITRQSSAGTPFLCQISPHSPHNPPEQAYRYRDRFQQLPLPKGPNFNENNTSDKPKWLRQYGKLDDHDIAVLENVHRDQTRSMLPVVDMLDAIIQRLSDLGELQKTFIFFYSDNGYHIGNHRMPRGKLAPYDEDFRIPFYARGPGVPAGVRRPEPALNIDLAPTFAEITGATLAHKVDGRSLLPLLMGAQAVAVPWRRRFLIEAHREADMDPQVPGYQGMLTPDYLYTEYETGEKEAYNNSTDPKRLHRIARSNPVYDRLRASLAALRDCAGEACRTAEDS